MFLLVCLVVYLFVFSLASLFICLLDCLCAYVLILLFVCFLLVYLLACPLVSSFVCLLIFLSLQGFSFVSRNISKNFFPNQQLSVYFDYDTSLQQTRLPWLH